MNFLSKLPFSLLFLFLIPISAYAQDSPQDYVDVHNTARGRVGVPPIAWDTKVAEYAQNYANLRKDDCELLLSFGKYGEVIQTSPGDMSGEDAVKLWAAERVYYDYNNNTCVGDGGCLEYTQVIWRNSTHLGCSKVSCTNGGTFIICNYDPPGNVPGEKPY